MIPFTRQLGARSGVQLNPFQDNTERAEAGNADQVFGIAGHFERGVINKAFRVSRSTLYRMLGQPSSLRVSPLNEAFVHIYEAFRDGAAEAVVYRLNVTGATNLKLVCKSNVDPLLIWTAAAVGGAGHLLTVTHLECFNDGITAEINALPAVDELDAPAPSTEVVLRLRDSGTTEILFEIAGSLDPLAKDDFGQSRFLPDIAAKFYDGLIEVDVPAAAAVPTNSAFYGNDIAGAPKFVSKALSYFTEGGTAYDNEDYDRAMTALKYSDADFGYLSSGGSQAVSLLSRLLILGKDINKQVAWDIDGSLTPAQAITFYEQLNIDSAYSQCYWSPLYCDDPVNGGKAFIGTSGLQIGARCARNAVTDANGIPPKNFPVAGKAYPVARTGVVQKYTPTEQELDNLANSRINPVLFVKYNSGGRYVFVDSLTGVKGNKATKLINVTEMASQNDDWVAAYAQECLQLPMELAIKKMADFLELLFTGEQAAKWIKPSADLDGRAFIATVKANNLRPDDRMDVSYSVRYDGTNRATHITQTISK